MPASKNWRAKSFRLGDAGLEADSTADKHTASIGAADERKGKTRTAARDATQTSMLQGWINRGKVEMVEDVQGCGVHLKTRSLTQPEALVHRKVSDVLHGIRSGIARHIAKRRAEHRFSGRSIDDIPHLRITDCGHRCSFAGVQRV